MFFNKIMKKILFSFFLVLTIVLFSGIIFAQTSPTPGGPAASQLRVQLSPKQTGRTVELSGTGLVPNFDVYIVDCLPTNEGLKCTTGNTDYDSEAILGIGGISPQVKFTDGGDALRKSDDLGLVKVSVEFIVNRSVGNVFYGIQINPPFLTNEGRSDSLQYGTFQFDPAITPISFDADPFGRIFDSQSLEPISDVKIRILDQLSPERLADAQPVSTVKVGPDGQFNFMVPKGIYYLRLDPATHPNHTFSATPNLHPNYTHAYTEPTENCYPSGDHQTCAILYQPDQPINEVPPDETERDIPLDPGSNPPYRSNEVSTMSWGHTSVGVNTRYDGRISHPFSIVKLVGITSDGEYGNATADKYGVWTITIPNKDILQNEALEARYTKVDLTTSQPVSSNHSFLSRIVKFFSSLINKTVSAQAKTPVFQPIPRYIEGYAYDNAGKIIPNAKVTIKLDMSPTKATHYQTTADENGFFKVDPKDLPIFSYYLEFTKPGFATPVKMTTADFAQKNASYLESNKIELMTAKKNNNSLLTVVAAQPTAGQPPVGETTTPLTPVSQPAGTSTVVIVLLLLGLVGLTTVFYLYLRKKKQQETTPIT